MSAPPAAAVGERVTLVIDGIAAGGAGVGRLPDGRAAFVHRTAPGDRVQVEVTRVKKRWARARLVRVLEAGPSRREPLCPHYERCGGCTLEHLTYEAQLDAKGRLVEDALRRIGARAKLPSVERHPSPRETRYRNRVSFTLRREEDGAVRAGFHELEAPDRLVEVDGRCLLPVEPVARVWERLRGAWGEGARLLPSGRELRLTLRGVANGEVLLLVDGGRDSAAAGDRSRELLERVEGLHAVWHRPRGTDQAVLRAGRDDLEELWHGERYPVRPEAFLQVNREAAETLHDLALREMGAPRGRRVVDAYCGVGVYGRRMARQGAAAVGIEADPGAVAMARARPVEGFRVLEGRVEERLAEALPADLVVLNPPRSGTASGVMETLAAAAPARVVYVSCDPATLARDVRRLGEEYRIGRVQAFDLFPQTAHVETVLTLDRREGS
jgi:23S rRNA (uracil1939-C5)-methyltransferase